MRGQIAWVAVTLGLAACANTAGPSARSGLGQFFRGTAQEPTTIDPTLITKPLECPQVQLQPGTEVIRREAAGADGPEALRWQASITKIARECSAAGGGVAVRVGVAGRVIEGPQGAPENLELPLRVAVREHGEVTYSRLHTVRVTMNAVAQDWAFVDEDVEVAAPDGADILVGFDS